MLSLSKTILPALRPAYPHVPMRCLAPLEKTSYDMNLSLSSLLVELATRLIPSGKLADLFAARHQGIRDRKPLLAIGRASCRARV